MDGNTLLDLLHYNEWANARILATIAQLPPEQLTMATTLDHGTAWQTLLHLVDVEWSWRLIAQGQATPPMLWEIETLTDLSQLTAFWQNEQATLRTYVQSLETTALQALVEFGNAEAPQQAKRWHILLHLLNHSTQHRTELARYLTDQGYSPDDLDLLDLLMGKVG